MSLSKEKIEEKLKVIISEQLGVELEDVKNNSSFIDDFGADSLDTVELVMELESEFDIDILDEEAEKILTTEDALQTILRILGMS